MSMVRKARKKFKRKRSEDRRQILKKTTCKKKDRARKLDYSHCEESTRTHGHCKMMSSKRRQVEELKRIQSEDGSWTTTDRKNQEKITNEEIEKVIHVLKNNKTSEKEGVFAGMVKKVFRVISREIIEIYRGACIRKCVFLHCWEIAKIVWLAKGEIRNTVR